MSIYDLASSIHVNKVIQKQNIWHALKTFICLFACMYVCPCAAVHVGRSEDNLWKSLLSRWVGVRNRVNL